MRVQRVIWITDLLERLVVLFVVAHGECNSRKIESKESGKNRVVKGIVEEEREEGRTRKIRVQIRLFFKHRFARVSSHALRNALTPNQPINSAVRLAFLRRGPCVFVYAVYTSVSPQ